MRQKTEQHQGAAERTIKNIGAATENVRFTPEGGYWRRRRRMSCVDGSCIHWRTKRRLHNGAR